MPRTKRTKSPAESARLQNPPKRQKQANQSDINTHVEAESSGARGSTNEPSINKEEWSVGMPLPVSQIPPGFIFNSHFQPQIATALSDDDMARAIKHWKSRENKSRPRFARLLRSQRLASASMRFVTAYLGFNTKSELLFFIDFEGKRLLPPFLLIQNIRCQLYQPQVLRFF
jgi:hypothetical protein